MKFHREQDGRIVVSLMRGDALRASLEEVAGHAGIVAARVSAIGALEDPTLGCYDLSSKTYSDRTFPGIWELLSLSGNISLRDGKPMLHAHASISGDDYRALGGHLVDAKIGVLLEAFIEPYPTALHRQMCDEIGLPRWEPGSANF